MSFFGPTSPPGLEETSTPLLRRAFHHARVVGSFAVVQGIVQIIGFLAGILIVRSLDQREYAYFTIANTMQGTLNVLADIGISIGLVSIGGRVWQDRHRFGQLITTARQLRKKLALAAILVVTPVLYFMLAKNGAPATYSFLLIAFVLAGLAVQLGLGVLSVIPRLRADLTKIQKIDLTGAIARLLILVVVAYLFLNAGLAVAIGSAVLLLQYLMLRNYAARVVDLRAPANEEDRSAMLGFIKNQAPNAIFFCFQGQITVLLIGFFAHSAAAVAEVGALGRLAMIFTVLSNLLTNVFAPAFARCHTPEKLRWIYGSMVGAVAAFSLLVLATAAFFPHEFLLVLGNQYAHLNHELLLMVAGSVLMAVNGTLWVLNASKAWIAGSWLYIPLTLAAQIALIPFIDFSSVASVLMFNLLSAVPNFFLNVVLSFRGFRSLPAAAAT